MSGGLGALVGPADEGDGVACGILDVVWARLVESPGLELPVGCAVQCHGRGLVLDGRQDVVRVDTELDARRDAYWIEIPCTLVVEGLDHEDERVIARGCAHEADYLTAVAACDLPDGKVADLARGVPVDGTLVDTDNCPAGCTARDNSHGIDEPIARVCRQQSAFPLTYRAGPIRSRLGGSTARDLAGSLLWCGSIDRGGLLRIRNTQQTTSGAAGRQS